jgi:hypothetical protein
MKTRTSRWFLAVGFGLSAAALAGACGDDPTLTKVDTDGDGYFDSQDCDDDNAKVSPSAFENCTDGKDNDCDGDVDAADFECGAPTGSGGGVGGAGGGGGQGGAGGAGPCSMACFDAIANGQTICPEADPQSVTLYNAVITCACGSGASSKCTAACSDDFCPTKSLMNVESGSPCQMCLANDQTGCNIPIMNCANDV